MKDLKVGLQLYSVREQMANNMEATLKAVKEMGYDYVEFVDYYGATPKQVKELVDKYELCAVSAHRNPDIIFENPDLQIEYLKTLGIKYSAIPWYTVNEYHENWDGTIETFIKLGELLKKNGIKLMYHNHDFEFQKINGQYILDKLYNTIPQDLFEPEFDTCWIKYAGADPVEYINRFSNRINVVHLKDFICEKLGGGPVYELIGQDKNKTTSQQDNGFKFKPVGKGCQDWKPIIEACRNSNAQYVIVEQDQWYDDDPLECARFSRAYLKDNFNI